MEKNSKKTKEEIYNIRSEIVYNVQIICKKHNADYRLFWNVLFRKYAEIYHINPHELYTNDYKNRSKLDMLEMYENLYGTLTKLNELIKKL